MKDITYAGPTGRELPGEHWNARIIREQAEQSARRQAKNSTFDQKVAREQAWRAAEMAQQARALGMTALADMAQAEAERYGTMAGTPPLGLWLIEREGLLDYDEAAGFVVAAADENAARRLASNSAGVEGYGTWHAPELAGCTRIGTDETGEGPRVILRDYRGS